MYNNGWLDKRSYITSDCKADGTQHAFGMLYFHGVPFRFALTQQHSGGAVMRGFASVNDPDGSHIMQIGGNEKTAIVQKLKDERPDYLQKMTGKRLPELNMTTSISVQSLDIDDIKAGVQKAVFRLYKQYAGQIHRAYGEIARPETITPGLAAYKHVDQYMQKNHNGLKAKTYDAYRNDILTMCMDLPHIPMGSYKFSMIQAYCAEKKLSARKKELLRKFWSFCVQAKICTGTLPFPPPKRKPLSDKAACNAARPDDLSLDEQDKLFELIYNNPSGGDCGVALQLHGGYSAIAACKLTWGDIIWGDNHLDYVRVKFFITDNAGATQNYTAPLFPAGGLVLRRRYANLTDKYSDAALSKMPIVSQAKDPSKAMTSDALVQHASMRLRSIGLTYLDMQALRELNPEMAVSRLLLTNTYAKNVNVRCSLLSEEGTAKFLLHETLSGNVSDDHYTCFSDDEAGARLHTIMSVVIPEAVIEAVYESDILLPDGRTQHTYTPETTRQRVGHVGHYTLLPGEELAIKCSHGVTGSVIARGFNADGSLRRKTRSKSATK